MATLLQNVLRLLKDNNILKHKIDIDLKSCITYEDYQCLTSQGFSGLINKTLWDEIIAKYYEKKEGTPQKWIPFRVPHTEEGWKELTEYLEANNIIWLSGEKFSKFIKRHREMRLPPMTIICDNYPYARLSWTTTHISNAISYKEYIAIKENIKKELDERADEIFKKHYNGEI